MIRFISIFLIIIMFVSCNNNTTDKKNEIENLLKTMPPKEVIKKISNDKDSANKFHTLAICYSILKDYDKSEEYYKKSLKLKNDKNVILNFSMLKAKKGKIKESFKMLNSIQSDNYVAGKITLAELYVTLKSPDRAIEVLRNIKKEKLTAKEIEKMIVIYHHTKSKKLTAEMYEYYIEINNVKNINQIKKRINELRI